MVRGRMAHPGLVVVVTVCAALIGCAGASKVRPDPLNGSWRVVTMQLVAADGTTTDLPAHESLLIFADGYYSIGYAFGGERPAPYAERWHPTDVERIKRFRSILVNAGTYRIDGDRLVARPLFALAPEFVEGRGEFTFRFVGDALELTWEKSFAFDGLEYPSAGTVTRLRLARAE